MLSPNDTECSRCGRVVGRGTHLRWYLGWAGGLVAAATAMALFFGASRGPRVMAMVFGATLVLGAGAALVWRARRPTQG